MQDLIKRLEGFGSPRVALVGDFMLDRYVYGYPERLSQEAPVPVLRVRDRDTEARVGAAGNVAAAVVALGAKVVCLGAIGADSPGEELNGLLLAAGAETASLLRLNGRRTTVKCRFVGLAQHRHAQQMFRVDEEDREPLSPQVQTALRSACRGEMSRCEILAIEDYNKGALTDSFTPQLIADATAAGKPVIVDPAMIEDYSRYRGATVLTPNRLEASLASGVSIADADTVERAARVILDRTDARAVMITLDKEGIYVLDRERGRRIATRPRQVYDVSGAGDQVLATIAVALAENCDVDTSAALANEAGGLAVERFGVQPISRSQIVDEMRRVLGTRGGKVMPRERLAEEIHRRRKSGDKVVFTNGCFDLLHLGHVQYLQQARELGDCLIVAINADDSVRRLKGASRPIIHQDERARMLGALECVDYVTAFEEDTPIPLLELLRPDLLVKGGTTSQVVGRENVEAYGGEVRTLDAVEGLSTTQIINRIVETNGLTGRT